MFFTSRRTEGKRDAQARGGAFAPWRRVLLRLEALEERTLLSAPPLLVTNLNDSGDGSLRAAVQAADATSGAVIDFARGLHGTITLTSGELDLTSTMTINGPGADKLAVSGNNTSRVFDIGTGQNVAISGLTIANGLAVQGGGIDNFGILSVTNCALLNNQAVGGSGASTTPDAANGGGIANEVGASLSLTNSLLKNNVAAASAGNDAFGGAVLNLGSTTVAACTFTGNQVTGGGSSSYYDGSYGGAIESFGFPPNQLYGSTLKVTDSTFNDNQAIAANGVTFGAAAAIDIEYSATATISNCNFSDNVGTAGTGGYGQAGALFAEGCTLTVSNSTFTGNQALGGGSGGDGEGGALLFFPGATVQISNCGFIGNQAIGGNGAPANQIAGQALGGAIMDYGASVTLSDSLLIGNRAVGGSDGANPTGGHSTGSSEYGSGGGVLLLSGATMTITDSALLGNVAEGGASIAGTGGAASGGGIEDSNGIGSNPSSTLTLSNSSLIGNLALGGAGSSSGVAGGFAFGGGLDIAFASTATISNITFAFNSAQGGAGGAGANGGDGSGGGIAVAIQSYFGYPDTSSLSLSGSWVVGNSAVGGSGGAGANGGDGLGGGLFVGPGGTATIDHSTITLNLADGGLGKGGGTDGQGIGGGIYNLGTLSMLATYLKHNHASTSNDDLFG
jgi:hypothetical protein